MSFVNFGCFALFWWLWVSSSLWGSLADLLFYSSNFPIICNCLWFYPFLHWGVFVASMLPFSFSLLSLRFCKLRHFVSSGSCSGFYFVWLIFLVEIVLTCGFWLIAELLFEVALALVGCAHSDFGFFTMFIWCWQLWFICWIFNPSIHTTCRLVDLMQFGLYNVSGDCSLYQYILYLQLFLVWSRSILSYKIAMLWVFSGNLLVYGCFHLFF